MNVIILSTYSTWVLRTIYWAPDCMKVEKTKNLGKKDKKSRAMRSGGDFLRNLRMITTTMTPRIPKSASV